MPIYRRNRTPILNRLPVAHEMRAGIVGGGIMGQLLAFALQQTQWQVTLFDFKASASCSEVAAGMLAPVAELEKNDWLIYQLGREALDQHWPAILSGLKPGIYFQKRGTVVLAHGSDRVELQTYVQRIAAKWGDLSFAKVLDAESLRALEPALQTFQQGYFIPEEGQIDSQAFLKALQETLIERGVVYRVDSQVEALSPGSVQMQGRHFSFDCVFDCRGLGAKKTFADLRGLRGELIWLEAPTLALSRPLRLLHPHYSLYLVPRPQGQYLIGASEIEASDYSPISLRSTLDLLTAAYSLHPALSEARILKMVTQCRPAFPDHLPRLHCVPGLIAVNGLYRHGFLIAPALVAEIQRWLAGGRGQLQYPQLWEQAA